MTTTGKPKRRGRGPARTPEAPPVVAIARREDLNGAPFEVTPEGLKLIERWSANGAPLDGMARGLGISRATFREIRKRQESVQEAIARGRSSLHEEITGILLNHARGGNVIAAIFCAKALLGWRDNGPAEGAATQTNIQIVQPIQLPAPSSWADYVASLTSANGDTLPPSTDDDDGGES